MTHHKSSSLAFRALPGALVALALFLGACGGDGDNTSSDKGGGYGSDKTSGSTSAGAADAVVAVTDSDLGKILVDGDGVTLYAFTNDTDGKPTCTDACAATWPAATAADLSDGVKGVDDGVLSLVAGTDGEQQLKAGDHPLYRYSGDGGPGDVNGQGSGDVWFVVAPDGSLIRDSADGGGGGGSGY